MNSIFNNVKINTMQIYYFLNDKMHNKLKNENKTNHVS